MLAMAHRAFDYLLETIGIVLLIGLTVVVAMAVGARRLDISMGWYDEVASIMLAWLTYYGAALAALRRGHMGFSGLFLALPPGPRRLAFAVSEILVIGFFVLLAWKGYEVLAIMEGTSLISLPWVPVAFTQSIIPIGAVLFILAEFLSMPQAWRRAFAGLDVESEEIERAVRKAVEKAEDDQ
jgi:TRAP-type C4-dicarboxylate transport system permease small subunit